jgi:putative oxidoreductase
MRASKVFAVSAQSRGIDTVLFLLRLVVGCAFLQHGWPLMQHPTAWGNEAHIPALLQVLAALSEFGGALSWIVGLLTRLSALGIFITMAVAVSMHMFVFGDPFVHPTGGRSYEPAAVYLLVSLLLVVAGPGRISLDRILFGKKA